MNENNKVLLTAIHVLLINTIKTRTHGIIYSKFSILTCENMVLCNDKMIKINKKAKNSWNNVFAPTAA
jgi:hypothetical protein